MGEQVGARLLRGYSSVGRAPALQAGGQGFESPYLHCAYADFRKRIQKSTRTYLENRILNRSEIRSNDLVKTSENKQKKHNQPV